MRIRVRGALRGNTEKGRGKGVGREGKGHQHLFFLNLTEKDDFFGKMILDKIFEK